MAIIPKKVQSEIFRTETAYLKAVAVSEEADAEKQRLKDKLIELIPQDSYIGMLLDLEKSVTKRPVKAIDLIRYYSIPKETVDMLRGEPITRHRIILHKKDE